MSNVSNSALTWAAVLPAANWLAVRREHAPHQVGPAPAATAGGEILGGRLIRRRHADGQRRDRRHHLPSPRRPRPQHAVIEHEVHARARHEHGQAAQEGPRFEDQVRIPPDNDVAGVG